VPPLFRFELSKNPRLRRESGELMHWFGLTDGRYWIDTGEQEIFRTTDGERVDYYVVRLWEDLLEILPDVLEPLPPSILARLRDMPRWLELQTRVWRGREEDRDSEDEDDAAWDLAALATNWFGDRYLSTLHLRNPPSVWFWREQDEIVLSWKTRAPRSKEDPAWSAGDGRIHLSVDRFLGEFLRFHEALMKEMGALVEKLGREYGAEADALRFDHERRKVSVTTADALLAQATKTDWSVVEEALVRLEAALG
jgi:hypothetical protein